MLVLFPWVSVAVMVTEVGVGTLGDVVQDQVPLAQGAVPLSV
jgi:hypothetical protein